MIKFHIIFGLSLILLTLGFLIYNNSLGLSPSFQVLHVFFILLGVFIIIKGEITSKIVFGGILAGITILFMIYNNSLGFSLMFQILNSSGLAIGIFVISYGFVRPE